MAVRESRRPGEGLFDFLDRTTHADSRMRAIEVGNCDCPQRNGIPECRIPLFNALIGKEQ